MRGRRRRRRAHIKVGRSLARLIAKALGAHKRAVRRALVFRVLNHWQTTRGAQIQHPQNPKRAHAYGFLRVFLLVMDSVAPPPLWQLGGQGWIVNGARCL